MGVPGPLPEVIVGFVLGHSLLSLKKKKKRKEKKERNEKEISVVHGVVDSDYIGKIKVLISPPTKTVQINKGLRVTQLLLLPYQTRKNLTSQARGHRTFRSSDLAFGCKKLQLQGL